jgi:ABC-type branched-subunit amino acid transport system substrate-binding protein
MKPGTLRAGVCGLAVAALTALTACSSSTPSSTPSSSAPPSSAPPSSPAASGNPASASPAAGSPIDVAFLTEFSSQGTSGDSYPGIQAAVKYINAHGGIKGRPLSVTECTDNDDPNLAAACATKAASNPAVIASIGQITLEGSVVDPIFQRAGLSAIGALANTPADFNSPVIFAPTIGGLSGLGSVAAAADLLHAKKIDFVYAQSPAAATEITLIDSTVLAPRKLPPMSAVAVSPSQGDMSAAVAKAEQSSPDAIILFMGQAQANSFVKAARQQGVTAPILLSALLESASAVRQQLGSGQGLYFYTSFDRSGSLYSDFLSQWQAAGYQPALADEFAINGWLAATMFADVARTLPAVTRASVMQAFSKLSDYSTDGLLPALSFDKAGTNLGGQAPRIINPTMGLSQYQNGAFVPFDGGKFTNPFVVP